MLIAIWAMGIFMLALWSGLIWAAHGLWALMATVSWGDAVQRIKDIPLPEVLAPWFGPAWREWIDAVAPVAQWLGSLVQGSGELLAGWVPVLLWVVWGLGTASLVAAMAAGTGGVWWWRRRQVRAQAVAA
jgi:hypothetical protein